MSFDFSNESDEQVLKSGGVIPTGSIVWVEVGVENPTKTAPEDGLISLSSTGFRQLSLKFTISNGEHKGKQMFQFIALPAGMQKCQLTQGQQIGCKIGGAIIKAMCENAYKPISANLQSFAQLNGLHVCVELQVRKDGSIKEKDGTWYLNWHNEVKKVIRKGEPEYEQSKMANLIAENGEVVGKSVRYNGKSVDYVQGKTAYQYAQELGAISQSYVDPQMQQRQAYDPLAPMDDVPF